MKKEDNSTLLTRVLWRLPRSGLTCGEHIAVKIISMGLKNYFDRNNELIQSYWILD